MMRVYELGKTPILRPLLVGLMVVSSCIMYADQAEDSMYRDRVLFGDWQVSTMRKDELPVVVCSKVLSERDPLRTAEAVLLPLIEAARLKHKTRFAAYFRGANQAASDLWNMLALQSRELAITGMALHNQEEACVIACYAHDGIVTSSGILLLVKDGYVRDLDPKYPPEIYEMLNESFTKRPGMPAPRWPGFLQGLNFARRINAERVKNLHRDYKSLVAEAADYERENRPVSARIHLAQANIHRYLAVNYGLVDCLQDYVFSEEDQTFLREELLEQKVYDPPLRYRLGDHPVTDFGTPFNTVYTMANARLSGDLERLRACYEEPKRSHVKYWNTAGLSKKRMHGKLMRDYFADLLIVAACKVELGKHEYVLHNPAFSWRHAINRLRPLMRRYLN